MSSRQQEIHNAVKNNNDYHVEELLKKEKKVFNKKYLDYPPFLYTAACNRNVKIVELLLEYEADVNGTVWGGNTPLMVASKGGDIDVMRVLLTYQADVNMTNWNGYTALHWSVVTGHRECALMLLNYGADVTLEDEDGETALMLAERRGHTTTAEAIRSFMEPRKTVSTQTPSQAVSDPPLPPLTSPGLPEGYTHVGSNVFANSSGSQVLVTQQLLPTNDNQAAAVVGTPYKRINDPNQIVRLPSNLFMRDNRFFPTTEGRPTQMELNILSGSIANELRPLSIYLGLDYHATVQIQRDFPNNTREQALEMLMRWRANIQDTESKRCDILQQALVAVGRSDLIKLIELQTVP